MPTPATSAIFASTCENNASNISYSRLREQCPPQQHQRPHFAPSCVLHRSDQRQISVSPGSLRSTVITSPPSTLSGIPNIPQRLHFAPSCNVRRAPAAPGTTFAPRAIPSSPWTSTWTSPLHDFHSRPLPVLECWSVFEVTPPQLGQQWELLHVIERPKEDRFSVRHGARAKFQMYFNRRTAGAVPDGVAARNDDEP
jgi:hypothetical protein